MKELKIEQIIRSGIRRFSDEVAHLWCALAEHFVRLSKFEKARDVYEEGECEGGFMDFWLHELCVLTMASLLFVMSRYRDGRHCARL